MMRSSSWVAESCEAHNAVFAKVIVLLSCDDARAEKNSCRYQPSFPAPDIASLASLVRIKPMISSPYSTVSQDGLESTYGGYGSDVERGIIMHRT